MKKYDYFIAAMRAKAHYSREWMLRIFSVVISPSNPEKAVTEKDYWMLRHTEKEVQVCVQESGAFRWVKLEEAVPYEIPFIYHDFAGTVNPGDVENVVEQVNDVTWGDLLFNSRVLVYASGARMPWQTGPVDLGKLERKYTDVMVSDVPEDVEDPNTIYVKHYKRFGKAVADLAGYEMFVPSVTELSLRAPEDNKKLRDELFEEYKDSIDDPVTHVKIQEKLVNNYIDKHIKGTPAEGFLYKAKSLHTALKRMLLIHGPEAGFNEGGRAVLVPTSLEEGTSLKYMPEMVNSLRAGSYFRGVLTAMAGEDVDLIGRIFQNARIVTGYCGTQDTYDKELTGNLYLGRSLLIDGKPLLLTEENIGQYKTGVQPLLSPLYCLQGHGDMCSTCAGKKISRFADGVGSMVQDIPSTMMARMMASAHAKQLKTVPLDVKNFLR